MPQNEAHSDPGMCRECLTWLTKKSRRCPSCSSVRVLFHEELAKLSIAHLDCDAFYAALEKRDDPSLADKPLIIGGGRRGVVATCCYIARAYGVHSAMPMFQALKACPQAVVLPPNGKKIREASRAVRAAMEALTPLVQPLSVDEAFMDLTGTEKLHNMPPALTLAKLTKEIEQDVGITVSVGLSHNKFLAKIASDLDKPRGFAVIGQAETIEFLAPLPIKTIWGVGKKFSQKLADDGLHKIGDLQRSSQNDLAKKYGELGLRLFNLARGKDYRPITSKRDTKSISNETTFNENIQDVEKLKDYIWNLSEKVSERMKKSEYEGRTITLKLKTAAFQSITRRRTIDSATNLHQLIFDHSCELLDEIKKQKPRTSYRLIGVGMSGLTSAASKPQDGFFDDDISKIRSREEAVDRLKDKFGSTIIGTGRRLKSK